MAFDQDDDASENLIHDDRFTFLNQNFRFLKNNLKFNGISNVDGIIADLGVSFHQFDEPGRGFTFRQDTKLDMRMNKNSSVTAADLLGTLEETEIANMFYEYGELTNSRKIAKEITSARIKKPITTVNDLTSVIGWLAPYRQEHKFYAKVFQALRIAVNHEIDFLKEMLEQALDVLNQGGRLVVITYHSLEDRVVKNFMKTGSFSGEVTKDFFGHPISPLIPITRKAIIPGDVEVSRNNRARSAKLRIAEKK